MDNDTILNYLKSKIYSLPNCGNYYLTLNNSILLTASNKLSNHLIDEILCSLGSTWKLSKQNTIYEDTYQYEFANEYLVEDIRNWVLKELLDERVS